MTPYQMVSRKIFFRKELSFLENCMSIFQKHLCQARYYLSGFGSSGQTWVLGKTVSNGCGLKRLFVWFALRSPWFRRSPKPSPAYASSRGPGQAGMFSEGMFAFGLWFVRPERLPKGGALFRNLQYRCMWYLHLFPQAVAQAGGFRGPVSSCLDAQFPLRVNAWHTVGWSVNRRSLIERVY